MKVFACSQFFENFSWFNNIVMINFNESIFAWLSSGIKAIFLKVHIIQKLVSNLVVPKQQMAISAPLKATLWSLRLSKSTTFWSTWCKKTSKVIKKVFYVIISLFHLRLIVYLKKSSPNLKVQSHFDIIWIGCITQKLDTGWMYFIQREVRLKVSKISIWFQ